MGWGSVPPERVQRRAVATEQDGPEGGRVAPGRWRELPPSRRPPEAAPGACGSFLCVMFFKMNGFRSILDLLERDEDGASGLSPAHGSWWVSRLSGAHVTPEVPTVPAAPGRLLSARHQCVTAVPDVCHLPGAPQPPAASVTQQHGECRPCVSRHPSGGCTEPPARAGPQRGSGEPGSRAAGVRGGSSSASMRCPGLCSNAAVCRAPARCWGVTRRTPRPGGASGCKPAHVPSHRGHGTGAEATGRPGGGEGRREREPGSGTGSAGRGRSPWAGGAHLLLPRGRSST